MTNDKKEREKLLRAYLDTYQEEIEEELHSKSNCTPYNISIVHTSLVSVIDGTMQIAMDNINKLFD